MAFKPTHEMHQRRFGRNVGLGVVLGAFVVLVFALTVAKVTGGDPMSAVSGGQATGAAPAGGAP